MGRITDKLLRAAHSADHRMRRYVREFRRTGRNLVKKALYPYIQIRLAGDRAWKRFRQFRNGLKDVRKPLLRRVLLLLSRTLPTPLLPPEPGHVRQIAVLGDMGIGNFIMFTPLLRALRNRFPAAEIVVLFTKARGAERVARRLDSVDRCISLPTIRGLGISRTAGLFRFLRREHLRPQIFVARFNGSLHVPLLANMLRIPWRVGHTSSAGFESDWDGLFNFPVSMESQQHEVERNLDLARALGAFPDGVALEFPVNAKEERAAARVREKHGLGADLFVCLQMGSSTIQSWKRWPDAHWQDLVASLLREGLTLVALGSRRERDMADAIFAGNHPRSRMVNLCGQLSLGETAAFLRGARLLVCNDSGLMHVAAAVGTPIVGIFGPTEFDRTRPYTTRCSLLRGKCPCNTGSLFDRTTQQRIAQCDRPCLSEIRSPDVLVQVLKCLDAAIWEVAGA